MLVSLLKRVRTWPWLSSCWVRLKVTVLPPLLLTSLPSTSEQWKRTQTPQRTTNLQIISNAKKVEPLCKYEYQWPWCLPILTRLFVLRSKGKWGWEVLERVINIKSAVWSVASFANRCFCPHPGDRGSWEIYISSLFDGNAPVATCNQCKRGKCGIQCGFFYCDIGYSLMHKMRSSATRM